MYYVITKARSRRGGKHTSVMGCHAMATTNRKLVDEHAKFLGSNAGIDVETMVLTEKQARELYENIGRKMAIVERLNNGRVS